MTPQRTELGTVAGSLRAVDGAGWQAHLEDLAAHLAGRPTADWQTRWAELTPTFRDQQDRLG
jgi:hypothetical protein